MKTIFWLGVGVYIGHCWTNRSKTRTVKNTELVVKMVTRGATAEELKTVGSLIHKYCPEI